MAEKSSVDILKNSGVVFWFQKVASWKYNNNLFGLQKERTTLVIITAISTMRGSSFVPSSLSRLHKKGRTCRKKKGLKQIRMSSSYHQLAKRKTPTKLSRHARGGESVPPMHQRRRSSQKEKQLSGQASASITYTN